MCTVRYNEKMQREHRGARGFALLPVVVTVGLLVAALAGFLSFLGLSEVTQNERAEDALAAYGVAHAGAHDAKLRLLRDADFEGEYEMELHGGTVSVGVYESPFDLFCSEAGGESQKCIVSSGRYETASRKVEMIVTVEDSGQISLNSFREVIP